MIGKSVFVVALSSYNMKKSLFERDWGVEDFKMQKEKWKKVVMDILAEMLGQPPKLTDEEIELYTKLTQIQKGSMANTPHKIDAEVIKKLWNSIS